MKLINVYAQPGALCPQCRSRLNVAAALPICSHCGWVYGQKIAPLPEPDLNAPIKIKNPPKEIA